MVKANAAEADGCFDTGMAAAPRAVRSRSVEWPTDNDGRNADI